MKQSLCLFLSMCLVGCLKPLPAEPQPPTVVEIQRVAPIHNITIAVEEDAGPPIKTWLSKEEVEEQRLKDAMEKAVTEDPCQKGDPLCEHIP